jgi:N-acetylglucosaminyl-diphospho-decaprenol L-rhamnosyltransferase
MSARRPASATAVYVAFRTPAIDTGWIPDGCDVVVVHNDRSLDPSRVSHPRVRHVHAESNLGFGGAVNAALPLVDTPRVVLCNPDTVLDRSHWSALTEAGADEVVTIPLVDADGRPTWVVSPYPTPLSALLTSYRVGRLLDRDGRIRARLAPLLGGWGRDHAELAAASEVNRPLTTHWASGAVMSWDTARLREVGGFDTGYFLYFEDVDLCARAAALHPTMRVRVAPTHPGRHAVGGSAGTAAARAVADGHHLSSVRRYAHSRRGLAWRAAQLATTPRSAWVSARIARVGLT